MKTGFAWLGALVTVVVLTIWNGIVLKILWGWFFVTLFQLPVLSTAQAMGVSLVVTFLTKHSVQEQDPGWEAYLKGVLTAIAYGLVALVSGWLIKSFI